jgi:hypothetical protein
VEEVGVRDYQKCLRRRPAAKAAPITAHRTDLPARESLSSRRFWLLSVAVMSATLNFQTAPSVGWKTFDAWCCVMTDSSRRIVHSFFMAALLGAYGKFQGWKLAGKRWQEFSSILNQSEEFPFNAKLAKSAAAVNCHCINHLQFPKHCPFKPLQ